MTHPNEDVVREGFAAFGRGDIDALQQYFAPGIIWHFPGRSPHAGHHHGMDQVIEFIGRLSALSGGTHRIELHDVIGNDEHVVALHTTRAERGGRKPEVNATQIFHVRDGKVTEAWTQHADLYAVDEFWSQRHAAAHTRSPHPVPSHCPQLPGHMSVSGRFDDCCRVRDHPDGGPPRNVGRAWHASPSAP